MARLTFQYVQYVLEAAWMQDWALCTTLAPEKS
jgi:hypothetical protein